MNISYRTISITAPLLTPLLRGIVIIGCVAHNNSPVEILPEQTRMKFNMTLGFIFSSIAIAERIFHNHNARIWAEGNVGGVIFYFTQPVLKN